MKTKTCSKCGEEKLLDRFAFRKGARDGRRGVCKACQNASKRDRNREYKRKVRSTPEGRAKARAATRKHRAFNAAEIYKRQKRLDAARPWRRRASIVVRNAVANGHILPASLHPCEDDDGTCSGNHVYHHDDYRPKNWYSVRVLCARHHRIWHCHNKPIDPEVAPPSRRGQRGLPGRAKMIARYSA